MGGELWPPGRGLVGEGVLELKCLWVETQCAPPTQPLLHYLDSILHLPVGLVLPVALQQITKNPLNIIQYYIIGICVLRE